MSRTIRYYGDKKLAFAYTPEVERLLLNLKASMGDVPTYMPTPFVYKDGTKIQVIKNFNDTIVNVMSPYTTIVTPVKNGTLERLILTTEFGVMAFELSFVGEVYVLKPVDFTVVSNTEYRIYPSSYIDWEKMEFFRGSSMHTDNHVDGYLFGNQPTGKRLHSAYVTTSACAYNNYKGYNYGGMAYDLYAPYITSFAGRHYISQNPVYLYEDDSGGTTHIYTPFGENCNPKFGAGTSQSIQLLNPEIPGRFYIVDALGRRPYEIEPLNNSGKIISGSDAISKDPWAQQDLGWFYWISSNWLAYPEGVSEIKDNDRTTGKYMITQLAGAIHTPASGMFSVGYPHCNITGTNLSPSVSIYQDFRQMWGWHTNHIECDYPVVVTYQTANGNSTTYHADIPFHDTKIIDISTQDLYTPIPILYFFYQTQVGASTMPNWHRDHRRYSGDTVTHDVFATLGGQKYIYNKQERHEIYNHYWTWHSVPSGREAFPEWGVYYEQAEESKIGTDKFHIGSDLIRENTYSWIHRTYYDPYHPFLDRWAILADVVGGANRRFTPTNEIYDETKLMEYDYIDQNNYICFLHDKHYEKIRDDKFFYIDESQWNLVLQDYTETKSEAHSYKLLYKLDGSTHEIELATNQWSAAWQLYADRDMIYNPPYHGWATFKPQFNKPNNRRIYGLSTYISDNSFLYTYLLEDVFQEVTGEINDYQDAWGVYVFSPKETFTTIHRVIGVISRGRDGITQQGYRQEFIYPAMTVSDTVGYEATAEYSGLLSTKLVGDRNIAVSPMNPCSVGPITSPIPISIAVGGENQIKVTAQTHKDATHYVVWVSDPRAFRGQSWERGGGGNWYGTFITIKPEYLFTNPSTICSQINGIGNAAISENSLFKPTTLIPAIGVYYPE